MSKNTLASTTATDRQVSYLNSLLKQVPGNVLDSLDLRDQATLADLNKRPLDKWDASRLINSLKNIAAQQPKPKREQAQPGYYVTEDGTFVVVVTNRAGTATYAKQLIVAKTATGRSKARWQYTPGLGFTVAASRPMTLTEATKFGHLHGVCLVCCRTLTDPESVKRGIGPVCATKF